MTGGVLRTVLALIAAVAALAGVSMTKTNLDGVYYGTLVCVGKSWGEHMVNITGNTAVLRGLAVCQGQGWLVNATELKGVKYTGYVEGLFVVKGGLINLVSGRVIDVGEYKVISGRAFVVDALVYKR